MFVNIYFRTSCPYEYREPMVLIISQYFSEKVFLFIYKTKVLSIYFRTNCPQEYREPMVLTVRQYCFTFLSY